MSNKQLKKRLENVDYKLIELSVNELLQLGFIPNKTNGSKVFYTKKCRHSEITFIIFQKDYGKFLVKVYDRYDKFYATITLTRWYELLDAWKRYVGSNLLE